MEIEIFQDPFFEIFHEIFNFVLVFLLIARYVPNVAKRSV